MTIVTSHDVFGWDIEAFFALTKHKAGELTRATHLGNRTAPILGGHPGTRHDKR